MKIKDLMIIFMVVVVDAAFSVLAYFALMKEFGEWFQFWAVLLIFLYIFLGVFFSVFLRHFYMPVIVIFAFTFFSMLWIDFFAFSHLWTILNDLGVPAGYGFFVTLSVILIRLISHLVLCLSVGLALDE